MEYNIFKLPLRNMFENFNPEKKLICLKNNNIEIELFFKHIL